MSSRYTKLNSKYILAKHHQTISQGTLFERDWTTIGNVHRLEPGKRPFYGSGNFIFTENTLPVYKKKRKSGKWVGQYTYEDVKDATDIVNLITVNTDSDKLSDYAYWGSMTELFRGSVEHIIQTFPGRLRSTAKVFKIHNHYSDLNDGVEYWTDAPGNVLSNPFDLNLYEQFDIDEENLLKYVALSWRNYVIDVYDNNETITRNITYYEIVEDKQAYDCEQRYFKLCYIIIFCGNYSFVVDVYIADGKLVYCYRRNEETVNFVITYYSGLGEPNPSNRTQTVPQVRDNSSSSLEFPEKFSIRPNDDIIEEYFNTLSGFEWKLLNRKTKPLYTNTFLLPIQQKSGNWRLVRRNYTWPSIDYCIDVESTDYDSFINSMISLCEAYDNLWCDSIWRCMVHESIKNFDWSYRREYDDNDTQDNIEGGNRMKDVMRLYGLIYDSAKRYVDGISLYGNVSYDGYNNCPTAQISDRNMLSGWDVTSTQHQFYWYVKLADIPDVENIVSLPAVPIMVDDDSPEYIAVTCDENTFSDFYHKETLPVSDITLNTIFFSSEDTVVEKQDNPWISENSYGQLYIEIGSTTYPSEYDTDEYTYNEFPYMLYNDGTTYPEYIKVVSNNGTKYYHLQENLVENNKKFVHDNWFVSRNENAVTPETTDILFNRMLKLSANRILKTKGTKEAVEMIMGMFGFGLYDEETNPHGDFVMTEKYFVNEPKYLNSNFYFYEKISEEEVVGRPSLYDGDIRYANPNESSDVYIYTTSTIEGIEYRTYYHLNGEHKVSEVVKLLYAHRLTERDDDYYSGVPLKEVYKGNNQLLIPFYEGDKTYEGNLYFEGKGGWMKNGETAGYAKVISADDAAAVYQANPPIYLNTIVSPTTAHPNDVVGVEIGTPEAKVKKASFKIMYDGKVLTPEQNCLGAYGEIGKDGSFNVGYGDDVPVDFEFWQILVHLDEDIDWESSEVAYEDPSLIQVAFNIDDKNNKPGNTWDYSETIPYLHILQKISDLFLINTTNVNNGDIYFVADVSNYYEYDSNVPYYLSNFFKLIDKYNPSRFTSWVNVPIEGPIQFGDSGIDGVTYSDYKHAKHLDEIIPNVLYNNPHCGYDRYDMGYEYEQYMEFPYEYSVENYRYDDDYYQNMASQFYFRSGIVSGDKIEVAADTYRHTESGMETNSENSEMVTRNHKYLKITLIDDKKTIDPSNSDYRMHLEYMKNVVMKYVVQTIPSTTLLVLENFEPVETMSSDIATISVIYDSNYGTVYGAGTYLKSTMITLKAVPNEGYHFVKWTLSDIEELSTNDEITIRVCENKKYNAIFAEDCGVEYGCQITTGTSVNPEQPVS